MSRLPNPEEGFRSSSKITAGTSNQPTSKRNGGKPSASGTNESKPAVSYDGYLEMLTGKKSPPAFPPPKLSDAKQERHIYDDRDPYAHLYRYRRGLYAGSLPGPISYEDPYGPAFGVGGTMPAPYNSEGMTIMSFGDRPMRNPQPDLTQGSKSLDTWPVPMGNNMVPQAEKRGKDNADTIDTAYKGGSR